MATLRTPPGEGAPPQLLHPRRLELDALTEAGATVHSALCARHSSALLSADGRVFTWGSAANGRLGLAGFDRGVVWQPTMVNALKGVPMVQLAAGDSHMLALASTGDVYSWGNGSDGQLGLGTLLSARSPRRVDALAGAIASIGRGVELDCGDG